MCTVSASFHVLGIYGQNIRHNLQTRTTYTASLICDGTSPLYLWWLWTNLNSDQIHYDSCYDYSTIKLKSHSNIRIHQRFDDLMSDFDENTSSKWINLVNWKIISGFIGHVLLGLLDCLIVLGKQTVSCVNFYRKLS